MPVCFEGRGFVARLLMSSPKRKKANSTVPDVPPMVKADVGSIEALEARRNKLIDDLRIVERQIYTLEESYIEETQSVGNVVKGWDGFATANLPRVFPQHQQFKRSRVLASDRIFSASSTTSPQQVIVHSNQHPFSYSFCSQTFSLRKSIELFRMVTKLDTFLL
jgi:hypothetical protein